jgi:trehalose 6-phosphate synthase/phosphatase
MPRPLPVDRALRAFRPARRRLILLDYDGTLVPIAPHPRAAAPSRQLTSRLRRLASADGQALAIVSGRPSAELDSWLGGVDGMWLAAEHGALLRDGSSRLWRPIHARLPRAWKARVRPSLERFTAMAPGSFVEEKVHSLAWHYRGAPQAAASSLAAQMVAVLESALAASDLEILRGKKCVEVRAAGATKGAVVAHIERLCGRPDFCLAIGDDLTDEDMFTALPEAAWTVHVGAGPSAARYRLSGPAAVNRFLDRLVEASC